MLTHRIAVDADIPVLSAVMEAAIAELQKGFLDPAQIESSRMIMGLDRQLVADGTYFVVQDGAAIAGCGGWSRRATLFGGNHTAGRDARLLDPKSEPARVRAMYTSPAFTRRGVGRRILEICEEAAKAEGFSAVELGATMGGKPLYEACGYQPIELMMVPTPMGVTVPILRMGKPI